MPNFVSSYKPIKSILIFYFIYRYGCFACIYFCISLVCLVNTESRRGYGILCKWSYCGCESLCGCYDLNPGSLENSQCSELLSHLCSFHMKLYLCCPYTLGHLASTGAQWLISDYTPKKTDPFSLHSYQFTISLLLGMVLPAHLPSAFWDLVGLNLYRCCVCCHNCEFKLGGLLAVCRRRCFLLIFH